VCSIGEDAAAVNPLFRGRKKSPLHGDRRRKSTLILLGAAALFFGTVADAKTVRLFAVGYKQRLADAATYETFRGKMFALVDASLPGRSMLVQSGVDDVASHIQPTDPSAPELVLVNFPEDVSLITGLIGSRGAMARTRTSAAVAITDLIASYTALIDHYTSQFGVGHFVGDLFVAATDTFYRSFYETFREIALTYGVYVTVSGDLAPARRVEEIDDPELVGLLRDPDEPERTYAYEAVTPEVRNAVFLFGPDGEVIVPQPDGSTLRSPSETGGVILPSITKAYLVPLELQLLGVKVTPVRDMDVVDTPVGRIGVVISKDAWMVDVNDRFEAKNAQVLVQSEAFSDWGSQTVEWPPDVFKEGGFAFVQKNPSFVVNVTPSLTGNLFDITFDGQSTILGKKTKEDPGPLSPQNAWIGQNPDTGFLTIGPWVIDDPGIADPGLTLAERRDELAATGMTLLPASTVPCPDDLTSGACRNGYRESVVHADVELPDGEDVLVAPDEGPRVTTAFGPNVRVNESDGPTPSLQKNPRIVARQRKVAVVWQDHRHGLPTIYMATSLNGGGSFRPAVKVSDNTPGSVAELLPDIALSGGRIVAVWQEFVNGSDDDRGRINSARFTFLGRKLGSDVRVDGGDDSSGKWRPSVAASGRFVYVAWIDERDVSPQGIPFEHVYFARSGDRGREFEPARRIDVGEPVALSAPLDNKWAPSVAAYRRHVLIAWTDFRNYNWDIFAIASRDRGETFSPNVRVDDFVPAIERLHQNPSVTIARRSGRHLVTWTDLRSREPDTNIFFASSMDGTTYSANRQLDRSKSGFDADSDTPSNQWSPQLAASGDEVCAAWQDNRLGNNDIFFAASDDGGDTFGADERVDDTGSGPSNQYNPDVAASSWRRMPVCYVVWEDTRDGDSDIFIARRKL
jgi:hypothetical protein